MTLAKGASLTEANKNLKNNRPIVVLVHGLHQTPLIMLPMARFFAKQGYQTVLFGYRSRHNDIIAHTQKLANHLDTLPKDRLLYLVGHSLGGLIVRHYLCSYAHHVQRAVTLGTPHLGSCVAHRLYTLAPFLLGQAYVGGLDGKLFGTPTDMGCIAGNRSVGLMSMASIRRYFLDDPNQNPHTQPCDSQNDGTVFIHETRLEGLPHLILPVAHTTMLFDHQVHYQTHYFLRFGHFGLKT